MPPLALCPYPRSPEKPFFTGAMLVGSQDFKVTLIPLPLLLLSAIPMEVDGGPRHVEPPSWDFN